MQIREASVQDIPDLTLLLDDLGYPTSDDALKKRFEHFMGLSGYGVAVAEKENVITGFIAWSRSFLFVSDMSRFHIEALVIKQEYRFLGIGKQLIAFMEDIAKRSSPCMVDLTSGLHRAKDGAHEFYKNLGYQNDGKDTKVYLRKLFS